MTETTARGRTHIIEIWGDFACFTRPELKVERYSYPVITPSAARGVLDAIYYKHNAGFYWQIEKIEVLKPARYIALRRNEVKEKVPNHSTIANWMTGKSEVEPLWADGNEEAKGRTQRQTMALKDVHYRLHAHMVFRGASDAKHDASFTRRASIGKCFYQPYLGCREFVAYFELMPRDSILKPALALDQNLGWMLYDVFNLGKHNLSNEPPFISLFPAELKQGVITVPHWTSDLVRKPE